MRSRVVLLGAVLLAAVLALVGSLLVHDGDGEQVNAGHLILWCAALMFACAILDYLVKRRRQR